MCSVAACYFRLKAQSSGTVQADAREVVCLEIRVTCLSFTVNVTVNDVRTNAGAALDLGNADQARLNLAGCSAIFAVRRLTRC